jgi:flavin reductase (DIM6/NTAB) family NADH-FMN oxidoreductase RutF
MHFDLARIAQSDAYKLLVSTVVPRPIALATTVDAEGRVNAAPFSFFNAVSSVPPVVVLGNSPGDSAGDGWKDTERNIRDTGEFVVNLVDEALAERMNICDVAFPTGINELEKAELHPVASVEVKPPRIAEAPVSF